MTKKSKCIVTDANTVIITNELGIWNGVCNHYQIFLPATIIEDELFYFHSDKGKNSLKPHDWLKEKKVIRIEAELSDYDLLSKKFNNNFLNGIDRGEREALAILLSNKNPDLLFSTADAAPIKALGALHLGEKGISTEELLINMKKNHRIPEHHKKKWFQQRLAEGFRESSLILN